MYISYNPVDQSFLYQTDLLLQPQYLNPNVSKSISVVGA